MLELVREIQRSAPPSRLWRNWWRCLEPMELTTSDGVFNLERGAVFSSGPHPSRDVAEQIAADTMARPGGEALAWLGAHPDGARPPGLEALRLG